MADGTVKIGVELDAKKLESQISSQAQVVKKLEQALQGANQKLDEAKNKQAQTGAALDQAKSKYGGLEAAMKKLSTEYAAQVAAVGDNTEATIEMGLALDDLKGQYDKAGTEVDKLQKSYDNQGKATERAANEVKKVNGAYQQAVTTQSELQRSLDQTNAKLKEQANAWNVAMKHAGEAGRQQVELGKTFTTALTAPLAAVGTYAAKAAIDFESAFAGVEKTVDGTTEQMERIRTGIIDMSKEMPQTSAQLSGIAEAAGQLGVSTDSVLAFTRVIADLKEATNLGEDAASSLAQFANITKMQEGEYSNLGSAIVDLGNNFATTEQKIVAMAMRLAGAGTQVGLSQSQILGFSAALSSVGIEAEAGGSAFSKIMIQMQLAAETGKDGLKDFAKVSGMTAKQFQTTFKKDAASAIQAFIVGLSKMDEQGISAIKTLEDMGISEVRLRDTLLRASNAQDLFADALNTSSAAWQKNTALTTEAEKRYQTFASRLQIVKNEATAVAQDLGEAFVMPALEQGLSKVSEWIKGFDSMSDAGKESAKTFALIAAGIGPAMVGLGKANEGIGALSKGVTALKAAFALAGGGLSGFGAGLASLVGPAGLLALGALGIYGIVQAVDAISKNLPTAENSIRKAFEALDPEKLKISEGRFRKIIDADMEIRAKTTVKSVTTETVEAQVGKIYQPIIDALEAGKTVDAKLAANVNSATVSFTDTAIEAIKTGAQAQIDQLSKDLQMGEISTTDYDAQVATIKQTANDAVAALETFCTSSTEAVSGMIGNTATTVESATETFSGFLTGLTDTIGGIESLGGQLKITELFNNIKTALTNGKADTEEQLNTFKAEVLALFDAAKADIETASKIELAKLDVDSTGYDEAATTIETKNNELIAKLDTLQAAADTWLANNSGKPKKVVEANLAELKAIMDELGLIQAELDAALAKADGAKKTLQDSRKELVKGGGVTSEYTIQTTLAIEFNEYKLDDESLDAQEKAAQDELLGQYDRREITIAEHGDKSTQITQLFEQRRQQLLDDYAREIQELVVGIGKADEKAGEQITEAAGKVDFKGHLDALQQKFTDGTLRVSDITPEIAKALGMSPEEVMAAVQQEWAGYHDVGPVISSFTGPLAQAFAMLGQPGAGLEGVDTSGITWWIQQMTDMGLLEGIEGFDPTNSSDAMKLMIGDMFKDPGFMTPDQMPEVPFEAQLDAILHPPKDGEATKQEAAEQVQAAVRGSGGAPTPTPVDVEPEPNVLPPKDGESLKQEAADQVQAAVQGSGGAPAEVTVPVEPKAEVKEPADGAGPAESARDAVAEDAENATEPVPVNIAMTATVTMDEASTASAQEAGKALANAVVTGANTALTGTSINATVKVNPTVELSAGEEGTSISDQIATKISEQSQEASTEVALKVKPNVELDGGAAGISAQIATKISEKTQEASTNVALKVKPDVTLDESGSSIQSQLEDLISVDAISVSTDVTITPNVSVDEAGLAAVGTGMTESIATGIKSGQGTIGTQLAGAVAVAKASGINASASFSSIGVQMCNGVAAGIRSGQSGVINAAIAMANAAKSAADAALDINSPSKVMIPTGMSISEGVAVGVTKGIPIVEEAMNGLAEVVKAAYNAAVPNGTQLKLDAINAEIDELNKILDAYEAEDREREEKKKIEELRRDVRRAKNHKERLKAERELNRALAQYERDRLKEQASNLQQELDQQEAMIDQYRDNLDRLVSIYDKLSGEIMTALKNRYAQEQAAAEASFEAQQSGAEGASRARMELLEADHKRIMDQYDAEEKAAIAAIQSQIDAIDALTKAEADAKREREDAAKIAELQAAVARAKNAKFRNEAQKKLDEELEKQAYEALLRQRTAEKDSLKEQIDELEEAFDAKREIEQRNYDAQKAAYEAEEAALRESLAQQRAAMSAHYSALQSEEALNAEARRLMLKENNDELVALLDSYNPDWKNAGKSLGEMFVEGLKASMANVQQLIDDALSLANGGVSQLMREIEDAEIAAAQLANSQTTSNASYIGMSLAAAQAAMNATVASQPSNGYMGGTTVIEQSLTVNIDHQVQSPAEVAYEVRKAMQEAAYGI